MGVEQDLVQLSLLDFDNVIDNGPHVKCFEADFLTGFTRFFQPG